MFHSPPFVKARGGGGSHSNHVAGQIHLPFNWVVADAAAKAAIVPAVADIYKALYQIDTGVVYILADDSPITWTQVGSGGANPITPDSFPVSTNALNDEFEGVSLDPKWVWRNQLSGVASLQAGSLYMFDADTTSNNTSAIEQVVAGNFKIRTKASVNAPTTEDSRAGFWLGNNASGKGYLFGRWFDTTVNSSKMFVNRCTNIFTVASNALLGINNSATQQSHGGSVPMYLEIEYDGTSLFFRSSVNGVVYNTFFSETVASFLAAVPDRVGLFCYRASGNSGENRSVYDWFRRLV